MDKLQHNCLPPIDGIYFKGQPLPTLLHYCQGYRIGGHGFGKRGAPENMFSCASPMFKEPPNDLDRSPIKTKWKVVINLILFYQYVRLFSSSFEIHYVTVSICLAD